MEKYYRRLNKKKMPIHTTFNIIVIKKYIDGSITKIIYDYVKYDKSDDCYVYQEIFLDN